MYVVAPIVTASASERGAGSLGNVSSQRHHQPRETLKLDPHCRHSPPIRPEDQVHSADAATATSCTTTGGATIRRTAQITVLAA